MDERSETFREEDWEALLSFQDLELHWRSELSADQEKLTRDISINDLVNVIRGANLRAQLANERDYEIWKKSWYQVKYAAMIKAPEMRAEGVQRISVVLGRSQSEKDDKLKGKVDIEFDTYPRPFRTRTSILNLANVITQERLLVLIGEPDQTTILDGHPPPYYFSGNLPRTKVGD